MRVHLYLDKYCEASSSNSSSSLQTSSVSGSLGWEMMEEVVVMEEAFGRLAPTPESVTDWSWLSFGMAIAFEISCELSSSIRTISGIRVRTNYSFTYLCFRTFSKFHKKFESIFQHFLKITIKNYSFFELCLECLSLIGI